MFSQNCTISPPTTAKIVPLQEMAPKPGEQVAQMIKNTITFVCLPENSKPTKKIKTKYTSLQMMGVLTNAIIDDSPLALRDSTGRSYVKVEYDQKQFYVSFDEFSTQAETYVPQNITLYSGMCLFSQQGARAQTPTTSISLLDQTYNNVEPILAWEFQSSLSLYELETAERLSTLLNVVYTDCRKAGITVNEIMLDIPEVAYFLYILEDLECGRISFAQALEWIGAVEARSKKVYAYFQAKLGTMLTVTRTKEMSALGEYVRKQLEQKKLPNITEALALLKENNPIASSYIAMTSPTTWKDVGYIGYVLSMMKAAACTDTNGGMLLVDNPTEWPLFEKCKNFAGNLQQTEQKNFFAKALFPYQQVFAQKTSQGFGESNFYFSRETLDANEFRTLFKKKFGITLV